MRSEVNIVIPAITLNKELIECLHSINKIKSKNFFVTIIFDYLTDKDINLKLNFKYNLIISGRINMSKKRNIAVKKFNSKYIIFFDSDIKVHNKWRETAIKIKKKYLCDIVGGPSIIERKADYLKKITYFSKTSYFVTGYLNFRKFKSSPRFCDWLESCNILMLRSFYLKFQGMNETLYTGEDKEFQLRIRKLKKNLKVFYHPDLYVFHRERKYIGFLLQRMTFGMDILNLINSNKGIIGFQPVLPLAVTLSLLYLIFNTSFEINLKIISILIFSLIIFFFIFFDQRKKNVSSPIDILLISFTIALANITFSIGSLIGIIGLKKILSKTVYRASRNN